jgi:sugar phosphate isomerase/epimerase
MHLKDAIGVQQSGLFLFPFIGEGRVDWKGMFAALGDIGYQGYMSVEFESFTYYNNVLKGDTREAARRSIVDVRAVLKL